MNYMKPELNQLGVAESLVLGPMGNHSENGGGHSKAASAFEFED